MFCGTLVLQNSWCNINGLCREWLASISLLVGNLIVEDELVSSENCVSAFLSFDEAKLVGSIGVGPIGNAGLSSTFLLSSRSCSKSDS